MKYNIIYTNKYLKKGGQYLEDEVFNNVKEMSQKIDDFFNSDDIIYKYEPRNIFYGLDISLKLNEIENIFKMYNYVQLRPYKGEKILVIGCGNRRLDYLGNSLPTEFTNEEEIKNKRLYDINHSHYNEFTIDLTLVANPSIIGNFDENTKFETIPDNSFNLIYFEGGGNPKINEDEIKRLLDNRTTSFCIGMKDGKYYIFGHYENGEFIKSFDFDYDSDSDSD